MRTSVMRSAALFVLSICSLSSTHGQGESAVPFLLIHPSPGANGWGNVGTAVASDNPISVIANPAQLGLFSLDNHFSASTYAPKTKWLPTFGVSDLSYSVWAISVGYDLSDDLPLPFPISIGAGYSKIDLDLGVFIRTNSSGVEIGRFKAYEKSSQFSFGIGLDYFVKLGIGWNFKKIVSSLSPIGTETGSGSGRAEPSATDFGILLQAPLFDILKKAGTENVSIFPNIEPLFNLTFGYARTNMSDKLVTYIDAAQSDPMPRNATIGLSAEFGIVTKVNERDFKMLTFTLAREAEDLLIIRKPNGIIEYQSGLGDISFFKHVVQGKRSDNERGALHKGWQLNLGEVLYIRGGSFTESPNFGNRNYSTSGFGIRLGGIFKLIDAVSVSPIESDLLVFMRDHIDIQYDHAGYAGHEVLGETKFNALNLVIR